MPSGLLCQEPQPGPTAFSAKFHQQTCSSSRRPTARWNLESIKQPAGEGDWGGEGVGGGKGVKEGSEKWGMGEKRNRIQNCSYTALCLALLPVPSHTCTHISVSVPPPPAPQNPDHSPTAFFFYVCSSILQVLFLMGHKQTASSAM